MSGTVFVAVYAITGTVVGLAYFTLQQWDAFFARHAIGEPAREHLRLHLMIGAAGVGAAWPVALVFALYGALAPRMRRAGGTASQRVLP
jgi:hypothetical protein